MTARLGIVAKLAAEARVREQEARNIGLYINGALH